MMNKMNATPLLLVSVVALSLSACGSPPKQNQLLENVRLEYEKAVRDVAVVMHAPEVLDKARDSLNTADSQWKKKDDQWRIEHYAYLAQQRIKTARLISKTREAEIEIERMGDDQRDLAVRVREAELKKAREEAMKLKRQMAALQAEQTERGMVLTLGDVLFDVDKASLAPAAARNIARIAAFMRNYPDREAVIEGHTDSSGEADYNLELSRNRAFSVRDALVAAGIDGSRMSTQGFGKTLPVADNGSAAGRQANRRVEIIFPDEHTQISEFDDY